MPLDFSQSDVAATFISHHNSLTVDVKRCEIKYMYICASIQLWVVSKKMCGKSCELMLKNLLPAVSPFFLEKNPQKCEIDPDSSGLPNVHHCVR